MSRASTRDAPRANREGDAGLDDERHRDAIVGLNEVESEATLVCPSAIDGSPLLYRNLVDLLGSRARVFGFDARSPLLRHRFHRSLTEAAQHYVEELRRARPRGPYWLFGFSAGGLVALEMAYELTAAGCQVPLVVLGDTKTADPRARKPNDVLAWIVFAEIFCGTEVKQAIGWGPDSGNEFWSLADDDKLRLLGRLRAADGSAAAYDVESIERDYLVFTDYLRTYTYHEPRQYTGPVAYLSTGIPRPVVERWVAPLRLTSSTIVDIGVTHHLQLVQHPGVEKTAEFIAERIASHARHH
jgi:thioesterase domain-containing protein